MRANEALTTRYADWSPTQFDTKGLNVANQQDWLVLESVGRNRDNENHPLVASNWGETIKALSKCSEQADDGNGGDWEILSFGHWACGWFEIIIVRPDSAAHTVAGEIECALSDYPVLNESDYSEREALATEEYWMQMSLRERVAMCKERGDSILAARKNYPPEECENHIRDLVNQG